MWQFYFTIAAFLNLFRPIENHNETLLFKVNDLLTRMLKPYDKNLRPNFYEKDSPIIITVDISVRGMGPISERDMEFGMNCYFRQRWVDERLRFEPIGSLDEMMLSAKFLNDIWRPDTYFRNGRKSYHHELTTPNTLVRVKSTGEVQVSQRITVKTKCPMYLKKFPMDSQACFVELSSLGHTTDELMFVWKRVPQADSITLSQYQLVDTIATQKNVSCFKNAESKVSTLSVYFQLKREQGYYLLQLYAPCTLMVISSWVSFWLNKEASPARVALGVMTILAMSPMGLEGRTDLPRVSYSTALDTYIGVCFGFVFCALVEYAVVNFAHCVHLRNVGKRMRAASSPLCKTKDANIRWHNMDDKRRNNKVIAERSSCIRKVHYFPRDAANTDGDNDDDNDDNDESEYEFMTVVSNRKQNSPTSDPNTAVDWIDTLSKILFPASYVIFNIMYWLAYLYWIPDEIYNIPAVKEKFRQQNSLFAKSSVDSGIPTATTWNETNLYEYDDNVNFTFTLI